ncbi:MAG: hypothetical protein ACRDD1_19925, partial [Planctomycetia bacterium]
RVGDARLTATGDSLAPNVSAVYGFRDVRGYDWPLPARLAAVLQRLDLRLACTVVPRDRVTPAFSPELAAFFQRAAIGGLITERAGPRLEFAGGEFPPWTLVAVGFADDGLYAPAEMPRRAWVAERPDVLSPDRGFEELFNLRRDGVRRPTLEVEPPAPLPTAAVGTVAFAVDADERVVLTVDSATGGLVVLADRIAEGWSATVDGEPAAALTTNYLFRGVIVPPGRSVVEWTYTAPGFLLGAWISAASTAVLLILSLIPRRRSNASPTAA